MKRTISFRRFTLMTICISSIFLITTVYSFALNNLAYNKTTWSGSQLSDYYLSSKAVDGIKTTASYWHGYILYTTAADFLTVDLGSTMFIAGFELTNYSESLSSQDFKIQGSLDNNSYTDLYTVSNSSAYQVTGSFLNPGTYRYVRVWITKSNGDGYARISEIEIYGSETGNVNTTDPITNIGHYTATAGGNVTDAGTGTITERGIVYGANTNPTISDTKLVASGVTTGSYSVNMSNLTPNTTYHVRSYVTTTIGTSYGSDVSFTTLSRTVTAVPDVALTETNLSGRAISLELAGNAFVDSTFDKSNFTLNNPPAGCNLDSVTWASTTQASLTLAYDGADFDTSVSNFSVSVAGSELTAGQTLTSAALTITATNDAESISISDDGSILEGAENGELITVTLTGGEFSATLTPANWTVSNLPTGVGKGTITRVSDTAVTIALSGNSTSDYDSNITNLAVSCTTAEYRDSIGGNTLSDNTGVTLIAKTIGTVTTNAVTSGSITAIVGGNVTSSGNGTISEIGVAYSTSANPTTSNSKVTTSALTTGAFSVDLLGLTPNTTYHAIAYIINEEGTSYGSDVSFTTNHTYTIIALADVALQQMTTGYSSGSQVINTITLTSTGTGSLTNLSATLSGGAVSNFLITQPSPASIGAIITTSSLTVKAKDSLAPGTYADTVIISADNMTSVSFTVSQMITSPSKSSSDIQTTTTTTTTVNGQQASVMTVNTQAISNALSQLQNQVSGQPLSNPEITLQFANPQPVNIASLDGQILQTMSSQNASLVMETQNATYSVPVSQIDLAGAAQQLGPNVPISEVKVDITIAEPSVGEAKLVEDSSAKGSFQIVVPAIDFSITCSYGGKSVEVSGFDSYVSRMVAIPSNVDIGQVTTAVVVRKDGSWYHVPTRIIVVDGKFYAQINSLTNSTYVMIWHPVTFQDVEKHWAKDAINDLGSRFVVSGYGEGTFAPDRSITRAEFAAILMKGLGITPITERSNFRDVLSKDWYSDYVNTAYEYKLISGYVDQTFRPNDRITREQAMVMIARALEITGLEVKMENGEAQSILSQYNDSNRAAGYAKFGIAACIKAGIVSGRNDGTLGVQASITRAEVAVIVRNLLKKSDLI